MNWEKLYNSFCTGATMVKQGIFIGFSTHASSVLVLALGSYLRLFVLLLWVLLLLSCCLFCCFFSQLNISSGELCGNPSCTVRLGEGVPEEDWIKWPQKTSCRRKQQQSFNFSVVHFSVTYFSKLSLSFFFFFRTLLQTCTRIFSWSALIYGCLSSAVHSVNRTYHRQ